MQRETGLRFKITSGASAVAAAAVLFPVLFDSDCRMLPPQLWLGFGMGLGVSRLVQGVSHSS